MNLRNITSALLMTMSFNIGLGFCSNEIETQETHRLNFIFAATLGDLDLAREFVTQHQADINYQRTPDQHTALLEASIGGDRNKDLVSFLLTHGADPNLPNSRGRTPLHYAISQHDDEVLDLLLHHGADPNHEANNGQTPLSLARICRSQEIIDLIEQFSIEGAGIKSAKQ